MMIRSWLFWVATALFALISLGVIWKVYPPLLGRVSDQRTTLEQVNQNITEEERYLAIVKGLKERQRLQQHSVYFMLRPLFLELFEIFQNWIHIFQKIINYTETSF
jgi:hypothetical protein